MGKEPILLIMAAGMGRRYGGLKQIEPITKAGDLIIDFSLYDAYRAGFRRAVIIIKPEMEEDMRSLIDARAGSKLEIEYVYQDMTTVPGGDLPPVIRETPWGTSHAVWCARNAVDAPFAVINADDYYGAEPFKVIFDFLRGADPEEQHYAMISYLLGKTLSDSGAVTRGVCEIDSDGMLKSVAERRDVRRRGDYAFYNVGNVWFRLPFETPVSMNFWGLTPRIFPELDRRFSLYVSAAERNGTISSEEYLLPTTINNMLQDGAATVKAFPTSVSWHGVTYLADKESVSAALEAMKQRGDYPENLWSNFYGVNREV